MRILFDVTHPLHVHLFRYAMDDLRERGHQILVVSRRKDLTTELLDAYGITHVPLSGKGSDALGLAAEWGVRAVRTLDLVRSFDPDVVVSRANPATVWAAKLTESRSIVFEESENVEEDGLLARLTYQYATVVCTPHSFRYEFDTDHRRYDGYHEMAYLHPDRFTPDPEALREHGVEPTDPFSVLRFVSWGAHHDLDQSATGSETKRALVDRLAEHGTVYVSAEEDAGNISDASEMPVPPHLMHQLLYFADVHVGDSGTTPIEAALLGTPAVCYNPLVDEFGIFEELEHDYGAIRRATDEGELLERVDEILADPEAGERWAAIRERIVADKLDLTSYIVDVVEEVGSAPSA